jgi:hypothetical protein
LRPGFTKPTALAWYSDHHHDASGSNVAYRYSSVFGYSVDLPFGVKTLTLVNMMVAVLPLLVTDTGFVLNEQVGAGETGGEIDCRELPSGLTGDGLGEPEERV